MTEADAARHVRNLAPGDVSVRLWLTAFRAFFPTERSAETEHHDALMLAPFIRAHGSRKLADVSVLLAQEWSLAHRSQLRYLRSAFEKAHAMGLVEQNVWRAVRLPPREGHVNVPTLGQVEQAIANARELAGWYLEFADVVEFCAFTGARSGGVSSLTRPDVQLDRNRVSLLEKGGKRRTVVMAPRARLAVERGMTRSTRRIGCSHVFLSRAHRPLNRTVLGSAWRNVRGEFDGPFHSLKHFAGTWMAGLGVNELDIAIQLGHTDSAGRPYPEIVRRVYVHPDHEAALERIEAAVGDYLA